MLHRGRSSANNYFIKRGVQKTQAQSSVSNLLSKLGPNTINKIKDQLQKRKGNYFIAGKSVVGDGSVAGP